MLLLVLFGFVAGAGTALSPCVLPVLPAVLAAGTTGGRRRPLGVVTGLALSFTFATVALVYLIDALGLPNDLARTLAIIVLAGFGITLLIPSVSARIEAYASRLPVSPIVRGRDGFVSGFVLGGSLGFVYAPCAGPILAAVITVSAAQDFTVGRLAVAFAYGIGSAVVLYALMLGGRRLSDHLSAYRGRVQTVMGVVMISIAALMFANLDIKFENAVAMDLPAVLVSPTSKLEDSGAVSNDISSLRGGGHTSTEAGAAEAAAGKRLPDLGKAPEFTDNQQWFNTPGGRALSLSQLERQNRVVLVDFWTYTCINCIRTLPYVEAWDRRYRDKGLTVVGVHTPEFPFEKEASNVQTAINDDGIHYPVAQDNDYGTWNAYGNQYWPAHYLIDANGNVRYVHFGEGDYGATETAIRDLLAAAGHRDVGTKNASVKAVAPSRTTTTPETYLGSGKARGFVNGPIKPGIHDYGTLPAKLPPDKLAYGGRWQITGESATADSGARLDLNFGARRVYLVMGSTGGPRSVRVLLDGRPIPSSRAGKDVHGGVATVTGQRLYDLVDLPRVGRHKLTLEPAAGTIGYSFTFG